MRNIGVGAQKPRSNRLLIGTDEADVGRRESSAGDRVARRHALPGGGGHQPFAQDSLRTDARPGPIPPRGKFRSIRARIVPNTVAEDVISRIPAQLLTHGSRSLSSALLRAVGVRVGDGGQFDTGRQLRIAA